ncbi:MAG: hypothetical protein IKE60_02520 [Reyranella sp.]|uniref:hypothetical protein n=1 Tax=Reyranella sp. TaxID=1929291 RepID=UPI0025DCAECA|nr:hypothetical protein [Reyranella sp.]MBR2813497.1 hypothetical protein [Reyranella sp.]
MANTIQPVQAEDPRRAITPGLVAGDYVPLTVDEFRHGFGRFMAFSTGLEPLPADFESTTFDALTGQPTQVEPTRFNRAWQAVGRTIADDAKRISFYGRLMLFFEVIEEPRYAKHFDTQARSMHVGLVAAFAQVKFSSRTTKKAKRAAFDGEFRRQYAAAEAAHDANDGVRH